MERKAGLEGHIGLQVQGKEALSKASFIDKEALTIERKLYRQGDFYTDQPQFTATL